MDREDQDAFREDMGDIPHHTEELRADVSFSIAIIKATVDPK
jgi:hypothetical protein